MNKCMIVLLLSILVMLAGCGVKETPTMSDTEPEKETITSTPKETEAAETRTAEQVTEANPETDNANAGKGLSKKTLDLLELNSKVTGIKYNYQDITIRPKVYTISIKGDKIKVEIPRDTIENPDYRYTTIYLDTESGDSVAYCEDRDDFYCPDPNKPFDIDYDEYYKKTPYAWLEKLRQADEADVVAEETIDKRKVMKVAAMDSGVQTEYWIDNYYGMPLQVIVDGNKEEGFYYFREMAFNKVKDTDVEHQFIESIG